ncbi:MAG TPA: hypothetical protein VLQ45_15580 [Thermoanaerobaculia bacterium]|nr:hypothetical protein [Thermoanaerobaculia bacterium]
MISEATAAVEARETRKRAVVLGFPVRRGTIVRQGDREIRKNGPLPPLSAFSMRREDLEEEIFELWEG